MSKYIFLLLVSLTLIGCSARKVVVDSHTEEEQTHHMDSVSVSSSLTQILDSLHISATSTDSMWQTITITRYDTALLVTGQQAIKEQVVIQTGKVHHESQEAEQIHTEDVTHQDSISVSVVDSIHTETAYHVQAKRSPSIYQLLFVIISIFIGLNIGRMFHKD